jgi:hypothetical protein
MDTEGQIPPDLTLLKGGIPLFEKEGLACLPEGRGRFSEGYAFLIMDSLVILSWGE